MKIAGSPTPVRDLTRWNRAGLTRFAYVEGGGAEWLEDLRVAHLLLFGAPATPLPSDDPDDWVAAFATGDLGGLPLDQALGRLASRRRKALSRAGRITRRHCGRSMTTSRWTRRSSSRAPSREGCIS